MNLQTIRAADDKTPDSELVKRVAAHDHEAFRVLMKRHNQMLYRAARSILKNETEAEDAVQEAYLQAYRAMGDFRGDAKVSTWLVRIVVNESITRLHKHARRAEVIRLEGDELHDQHSSEDSMNDSPPELPERAALRSETRRLLETKIDELPDAFRTVFVLRAVEEMSVEEAAAVLGIPEATVRTRFFRAKGMLRESLSREIDLAHGDAFSFAGARCDRIIANVIARLAGGGKTSAA
ncbi:MAG TPA: RNA polymerase sigma factor [Burkholderiales bacterium]|nr:RNA polymerase sigma factor [Burkholderiales bacterium]